MGHRYMEPTDEHRVLLLEFFVNSNGVQYSTPCAPSQPIACESHAGRKWRKSGRAEVRLATKDVKSQILAIHWQSNY